MEKLKLVKTEYGKSYVAEKLTYEQAHEALREWAKKRPGDSSKIVVSGEGFPTRLTVSIDSTSDGKPTDLTVAWLNQFTGRGEKSDHWVYAGERKFRYPQSDDDRYDLEIYAF
jgi:hypothetical protein